MHPKVVAHFFTTSHLPCFLGRNENGRERIAERGWRSGWDISSIYSIKVEIIENFPLKLDLSYP